MSMMSRVSASILALLAPGSTLAWLPARASLTDFVRWSVTVVGGHYLMVDRGLLRLNGLGRFMVSQKHVERRAHSPI